MTTVIALLRAVNVGGNTVAMADLRALAAGLGYRDPRTLLASGNLVFEADPPLAEIETQLEAGAKHRLGLATEFILRTPGDWRKVIVANPFPEAARDAPTKLVVAFAKKAPDRPALAALKGATEGLSEQLEVVGRETYIVYPDGQGRSKLGPVLARIERRHPMRATARNWNTVLKIAGLAGA